MPKINLDHIEQTNAIGYPFPFDRDMAGRWYRRLAPASGLTDFGVSHVVLKPGGWSSQRHWHDGEDEFVVMLSGTAMLIEDDGETVLIAGDCAAFPKGIKNGHHLVNRSEEDCVFLAFSGGERTGGGYSDIDMMFTADSQYIRKDGTPYNKNRV
jgi:uncharacterized cupin superfamily protein